MPAPLHLSQNPTLNSRLKARLDSALPYSPLCATSSASICWQPVSNVVVDLYNGFPVSMRHGDRHTEPHRYCHLPVRSDAERSFGSTRRYGFMRVYNLRYNCAK
ncbi:unnamed protein product [Euphydryas editha]|uniref:Uncharacterized protein n=1 Tax=Euphydryas editha TaxID=104508 RepID=A0AAU9UWX3_EUPED|nr:unnamed protein product [Euphydryas editha]